MLGKLPARRDRDGGDFCKWLDQAENPNGKREKAKRGCGWRANRRERGPEISTECIYPPRTPLLPSFPSSSSYSPLSLSLSDFVFIYTREGEGVKMYLYFPLSLNYGQYNFFWDFNFILDFRFWFGKCLDSLNSAEWN